MHLSEPFDLFHRPIPIQVGRPLTWEESLEHLKYVREHGVLQFLATYEALKGLVKPELKWGEEMEFGIFKVCKIDHAGFESGCRVKTLAS